MYVCVSVVCFMACTRCKRVLVFCYCLPWTQMLFVCGVTGVAVVNTRLVLLLLTVAVVNARLVLYCLLQPRVLFHIAYFVKSYLPQGVHVPAQGELRKEKAKHVLQIGECLLPA